MGDKFQTLFNGIQNIFQPAVDVYNQQQQQKQAEQLLAQYQSLMSQGATQQTSVQQMQNTDQNQSRIGGIIEKGIKGFQNWKSKNGQSVKTEKKGGKIKKIRKGQNSLDTDLLKKNYGFSEYGMPLQNGYMYSSNLDIPSLSILQTPALQAVTPDLSGMGLKFGNMSLENIPTMDNINSQVQGELDKKNQITTIQSKITSLKAKKNSSPLSNLFGANDLKTAKKTKELADLGEGDAKEAGKALKGARMNTAGMTMGAAADIGMGVMDALKPDKYVGASDKLMKMKQGYDAASNVVMQINPLAGGIMKGVEGVLQLTNMLTGKKADSFTVDDQAYENVGGSYSGSYAKAQDAAEKAGTTYGGFAKKQYKKAQEEIAEAKRQQSIVEDVSDTATERFNISDSMAAINNNRRELEMEGGYHQNAVSVGEEGEKLGKSLKRVKRINKKRKKKLQLGGIIGEPDSEKANVTSYSSYNKPVITREAIQPVEESRIITVNPELYFPTANSILIPTEEELNRRLNNEYTNIDIPNDDDIEQIIANINADKPRSMDELIQYAEEKNPRFIQRMKEFPMILTFTNDYSPTKQAGLGQMEHGSHLLGWEYGPDGQVYVFPMIMEKNEGQGDLFKWDNNDFRLALNEAIMRGDYLNMSEDEADLFTENYKKYYNQFMNVFDEMDEYLNSHPDTSDQEVREIFMNKYNNNIIPEYQEGGSIIPDGALHAHKHHIETDENITQKGIPVVIENKDGEIEQVAEIERGEIIFSKEFTEKLENLCKQYYNNEIEHEEKENVALQAGQLLVNEILNNTEDKTRELL